MALETGPCQPTQRHHNRRDRWWEGKYRNQKFEEAGTGNIKDYLA